MSLKSTAKHFLYASVLCAALSGCALFPKLAADNSMEFVRVKGAQFHVAGKPYYFVGVNMWYAAYLGAEADYGDRERLVAELDLLQSLGVANLRILGASETSPFQKSLRETFQSHAGAYNEQLLQGLDFALAEMAKRNMRAVIYLNNFWEWSGGMGTYLYWTNGGSYVDLGDPAHPWPAFQNVTAYFYESEQANNLYRDYIRMLVSRVNTVTGLAYRDDPAIMAWQLANEPRPGFDYKEGDDGLQSFYEWIEDTAHFIKSLDPNHLVSSGNEGFMVCNEIDSCFFDAHETPAIDYLTFHIWPRNWGWMDMAQAEKTFPTVLEKTDQYIKQHISYAERLNKPVVLEEFGLDRDGGENSPGASVNMRNDYLSMVFTKLGESASKGAPFSGVNIWAWGGYGEAAHPDYAWRDGDVRFTGDPPQEPQGRNSVFASDLSTLGIIKAHAQGLP